MLMSPTLWERRRRSDPVEPPKPAEEKMRTAPEAAAPPPSPGASPAIGVVVPNLVGMPIVEARAAIARIRNIQIGSVALPVRGSELQLMLLEVTREAPGQIAGTVLSQTPAPDTRVQQRTSIEVIVAK
jgi:hypothetical protein